MSKCDDIKTEKKKIPNGAENLCYQFASTENRQFPSFWSIWSAGIRRQSCSRLEALLLTLSYRNDGLPRQPKIKLSCYGLYGSQPSSLWGHKATQTHTQKYNHIHKHQHPFGPGVLVSTIRRGRYSVSGGKAWRFGTETEWVNNTLPKWLFSIFGNRNGETLWSNRVMAGSTKKITVSGVKHVCSAF